MPLSHYLTLSRTLVLQASSKDEALKELALALCRHDPVLDVETVMRAINDREHAVSSRIAPRIALPHALVSGYNRQTLAVGYSPAGISWDSPGGGGVNLVVMSVCGEALADAHIRMLAELAGTLQDENTLERLTGAGTNWQVYEVLRGGVEIPPPADARKVQLCRYLAEHAAALARQSGAGSVMVLADDRVPLCFLEDWPDDVPLILAADDAATHLPEAEEPLTVLSVPMGHLRRAHRVKLAFLFALSNALLEAGETVVCASGEPGSGVLSNLELVEVAREFDTFLTLRPQIGGGDLSHHVLDRVLHIATSLAREGREGRPVGAIFILGDYENVQKRCRQLVMNPFRGYPENDRNVLDPSLEETVKEFSRIDGAFLIRGDGVIMSMGAFIQTEGAESLAPGLGARHAAALAITASTRALSICLSESTRRVSLFHGGKLIMTLDQAAH